MGDPEHAELQGHIIHNEFHGADNNVFVTVPGLCELNARADGKRRLTTGQPIGITLDKSQLHFFGADGARVS